MCSFCSCCTSSPQRGGLAQSRCSGHFAKTGLDLESCSRGEIGSQRRSPVGGHRQVSPEAVQQTFLPGELGQEELWELLCQGPVSCPGEEMDTLILSLPQGASTRGGLHRWPWAESGGWDLPWECVGSWEGQTTASPADPQALSYSMPPPCVLLPQLTSPVSRPSHPSVLSRARTCCPS